MWGALVFTAVCGRIDISSSTIALARRSRVHITLSPKIARAILETRVAGISPSDRWVMSILGLERSKECQAEALG